MDDGSTVLKPLPSLPPSSQRHCLPSRNSSLSTHPPAGILRSQRRRHPGHVPSHPRQSCSTWASLPAPMPSITSWTTSSLIFPDTSCTGELLESEGSPSSTFYPPPSPEQVQWQGWGRLGLIWHCWAQVPPLLLKAHMQRRQRARGL